MRRECAGARPNTCLGNRRIGDRHGHTLIFRQIRSSDRRRGNRSHRTGLLDLAPSRFLSARHFVHTTVIYHLGKSFIKGYAHLVTLVQTERRRFYLTAVERDAVTGLRRILGSEDQVVEGIIGTGHIVHHHSVQIAICIGIHRSLRISHLCDQLGNGNGRSLTRIGRHHTAFEIDLLTAVALDELYVIDCEYRRQISRETDRKLADSLLEREIYGELDPVRIGRIAAADLLVSQIARPVGSVTYGNVERFGFENVVVSTAVTLRISTAEDDPVVGLARRHRNSVDVESRRCRTEENLVRTRSTVVTAAELTGSTHRYVRRGIGHRRITRTGSILPCIGLIEERPFIIDLLGRRLVEIVLVNRIAARIGRHDTAARQVDLLAAVTGHQRDIVQTELRRCFRLELDVKRRSRILERKVLGCKYPVRIDLITVVYLVRQRSIVRSVRTEINHEVVLVEIIVIVITVVILSAESQLQIGLAGGERYVFNRKGCRSRAEEDHVRARSTVISTRAALTGSADRSIHALVGNLRSPLAGGVPTRIVGNQRIRVRNGLATCGFVEDERRRHHFALKHIDILLNQCAVGVVNLESHFSRLTDVRSGHRNGHGSIALAFGSRKAHPSLFILDDSTPGTVRFNDKSTVVLICGLSLRIERQVLRRDVQIGSTHVVIVVGTSREHRYGEHGQCTEEQFPNATLFHKQLNFRVI